MPCSPGSGAGGRVTRDDVMAFIAKGAQPAEAAAPQAAAPQAAEPQAAAAPASTPQAAAPEPVAPAPAPGPNRVNRARADRR